MSADPPPVRLVHSADIPSAVDRVVTAEQAILGMALCDPRHFLPELPADKFGEGPHRRLWAEIAAAVAEGYGPDELMVRVAGRMASDPGVLELGGLRYLADLYDRAPLAGDPRKLAREVEVGGVIRAEARLREAGVDLPLTAQREAAEARWTDAGGLPLTDPSTWEGAHVPGREWLWHENIPWRQATYLTGAGSAGKSLVGQQLATCSALGLPFLGVETRQTVAVYVTCEDDLEELHRRQDAICYALGVSLADLAGRLQLVSLAGAVGNELAIFDPLGRMQTTPTFARLRSTVLGLGAGFVVLDNVAHLFAGNENIRNQVAGFCALMNSLAAEGEGQSVLFIGHPNKAGDNFSGSTAWENQVRSRLFLERPEPAEGEAHDPDARVLTRGKANYARKGDALAFRWWRWAFIRDADLPGGEGATLAAHARESAEDSRFLACLAATASQKRAVSHVNGINWAPRIFVRMTEAQGMGQEAFSRAMERLFGAGVIVANEALWMGDNRHIKRGLKLASECADPCADPRANPPR